MMAVPSCRHLSRTVGSVGGAAGGGSAAAAPSRRPSPRLVLGQRPRSALTSRISAFARFAGSSAPGKRTSRIVGVFCGWCVSYAISGSLKRRFHAGILAEAAKIRAQQRKQAQAAAAAAASAADGNAPGSRNLIGAGCATCQGTFETLESKIHTTMPQFNSPACQGACAENTAAYIFCEFNPNLAEGCVF